MVEPAESLQELVRQAERVVDAQLRSIEEGNEKSRHWMATTVAVYGASAAVAALAGRFLHGLSVWPALALIALSVILGGRAFVLFAHAYAGEPDDEAMRAVGWGGRHLVLAVEARATCEEVLEATIREAEMWIGLNGSLQAGAAKMRRRGRYWLFAAAASLAAAFIYSLGVNAY